MKKIIKFIRERILSNEIKVERKCYLENFMLYKDNNNDIMFY